MDSYSKNIFTSGPVGYPNVTHIDGKDFSPVIQKALELPGFQEDTVGKSVLVGFGITRRLVWQAKLLIQSKWGILSGSYWSVDVMEPNLDAATTLNWLRRHPKTLSY
jgi:hypothetical protein